MELKIWKVTLYAWRTPMAGVSYNLGPGHFRSVILPEAICNSVTSYLWIYNKCLLHCTPQSEPPEDHCSNPIQDCLYNTISALCSEWKSRNWQSKVLGAFQLGARSWSSSLLIKATRICVWKFWSLCWKNSGLNWFDFISKKGGWSLMNPHIWVGTVP